jgi:hypothetical protein
MNHLRKTSTYNVSIEAANPIALLSTMLANCPAEVNGSGVIRGRAFVRFRCESDDYVATAIAMEIAEGREYVLTTGYGVNERPVEAGK